MKLAAILVAMMLVAAGCGARLSKTQLAQAAGSSGGSGGVSAGAAGGDQGGPAAGGDQGSATGGATSGGSTSGGTSGGSTGGPSGPSAQAAGAAGACAATGGNSDVGVTANSITLANVSLLTGPVPGLFKGAKDGTQAFFNYQNST